MSKVLSKKLISAELMVATSLLLAPGFSLTGYGQNTPPIQPAQQPVKHPANRGPGRHSARLLGSCVLRPGFERRPGRCENARRQTGQH